MRTHKISTWRSFITVRPDTNEESMVSDLKYMAALGKSDHLQLIFNFSCYIDVKRHSFKNITFSRDITLNCQET